MTTPTLTEVVASVERRALPDRLAALAGTVRFVDARTQEQVTVRFDRGAVGDVADDAPPDVVVRGAADLLAAVVAGECNAGLEFLRGSLDISGDTDLALAVGGLFEVAGSPGVAMDPQALDPVAVAGVLGEVRKDHLERVMRSGFRPVVLGEIFRRLPEFVDPVKAARVELSVAFRLTGRPDGEVERYVVTVGDGAAVVQPGEPGRDETRDATVTCEAHEFLRLATGHLNPVLGVLRGRLKVRGDQAKALQLASVIDIPRSA